MKRLCVFIFALFAIGTANADDTECTLGQFFNGTSCETCPIGTTTNTTSATECTPCPVGTYGVSSGRGSSKRAVCEQCSAGTYSGITGAKECKKCPDGTAETQSSSWCSTIDNNWLPGTYYEASADAFLICPAGTYNDEPSATECTRCPSGTYSNAGAAVCGNLADVCPSGTYGNFAGRVCEPCPDEYPYSDPGVIGASNRYCYSDVKIRDCSPKQPLPMGCNDVTYNFTSCSYVEYRGTVLRPGELKEGCASCDDVRVLSISAFPGFRVDGDACVACPAGTYSPGGDVTTCEPCPDGATTLPGAASRDECMRILNYLPSGNTIPNKIYLAMKKTTQPSLAVQVGNNVFYGNMTPIPDDKTVSGMNIKYDDTNYSVSSNMGSSAFYIITTPDTTEFSFRIATHSNNFVVDWGDGTADQFISGDIEYIDDWSHTYDAPGEYVITISGQSTQGCYAKCTGRMPNINGGILSFSTKENIARIGGSLAGLFAAGDNCWWGAPMPCFGRAFSDCPNLTGIVSQSQMFGECDTRSVFFNSPNAILVD